MRLFYVTTSNFMRNWFKIALLKYFGWKFLLLQSKSVTTTFKNRFTTANICYYYIEYYAFYCICAIFARINLLLQNIGKTH